MFSPDHAHPLRLLQRRPGNDADFDNTLRVYVEMLDNCESEQRALIREGEGQVRARNQSRGKITASPVRPTSLKKKILGRAAEQRRIWLGRT